MFSIVWAVRDVFDLSLRMLIKPEHLRPVIGFSIFVLCALLGSLLFLGPPMECSTVPGCSVVAGSLPSLLGTVGLICIALALFPTRPFRTLVALTITFLFSEVREIWSTKFVFDVFDLVATLLGALICYVLIKRKLLGDELRVH